MGEERWNNISFMYLCALSSFGKLIIFSRFVLIIKEWQGYIYIYLFVKSSVFTVISITLFQQRIIHAFIDALLKEASLRKDYLGNETVSTIYFGGGTPSVFSS